MKHLLLISAMIFAITTIPGIQKANAQQQPESPRMTAKGKGVSVSYGQPSKKNRKIFGELVPYGQVWRTGANEATEITFDTDVDFGGTEVKAGTYTLFTIPGEDEWEVILNSSRKQWGAFQYDKIKDKDVVHVKASTKKLDEPVEKFTMEFDEDNNLLMSWDDTQAMVRMKTLSN